MMLFKYKLLLLFFILVLSFYSLNAQETVLDSFRYRANLLIESDWTVSDIDLEIEFGKKLAARILGQYNLSNDDKLQEYINLLGQGIAASFGRPEITYYFAVIDSAHINAYATPGGYVFITKGLIDKCNNEAQLVGVLAHEISHINRRYIINKYNIRGNDSSLLSDIGNIVGGASQSMKIALNMVIEKVMDELFIEGLDKEEEINADLDSLLYMTLLNYDWTAYSDLVVTLDKDSQTQSVSHTHPSSLERSNSMSVFAQTNKLKGELIREKRFKKYQK